MRTVRAHEKSVVVILSAREARSLVRDYLLAKKLTPRFIGKVIGAMIEAGKTRSAQ